MSEGPISRDSGQIISQMTQCHQYLKALGMRCTGSRDPEVARLNKCYQSMKKWWLDCSRAIRLPNIYREDDPLRHHVRISTHNNANTMPRVHKVIETEAQDQD